MATRFLIVQHAAKESQPGDPGLSALGHLQAEEVAEKLSGVGATIVHSSHLRRAQETAGHVARRLGVPAEVDERLTERMNWEADQTAEEFLADWARASTERDFQPRHGDSSSVASARLRLVLVDLAARYPGRTVVVIGHGGVTVDLARDLVGDEYVRSHAPGAIEEGIPNCAITEFVCELSKLRMVGLGRPAADLAGSRDRAAQTR